jgi:hypothetical protein
MKRFIESQFLPSMFDPLQAWPFLIEQGLCQLRTPDLGCYRVYACRTRIRSRNNFSEKRQCQIVFVLALFGAR